jgi:hypothetical protein
MGSLMWIIFIIMMGTLLVSLLWLIWKLRNFSQSHNQSYADDKLMQEILSDARLKKEVKKAVLTQSTGVQPVEEEAAENKETPAP